jgi:hypothetical protein
MMIGIILNTHFELLIGIKDIVDLFGILIQYNRQTQCIDDESKILQ